MLKRKACKVSISIIRCRQRTSTCIDTLRSSEFECKAAAGNTTLPKDCQAQSETSTTCRARIYVQAKGVCQKSTSQERNVRTPSPCQISAFCCPVCPEDEKGQHFHCCCVKEHFPGWICQETEAELCDRVLLLQTQVAARRYLKLKTQSTGKLNWIFSMPLWLPLYSSKVLFKIHVVLPNTHLDLLEVEEEKNQ